MDTLKPIPGFTPTTAGQMLGQNRFTSSQNQNPQSTPNNTLTAIQFNENDFSDDDDLDLDTDYALPLSQSSFTHSQPQSQSVAYSSNMSPPTQNYGRTLSSSSFQQGYPTMTQGSYSSATFTSRQPLASLSNSQMSPSPSIKTHTPSNVKAQSFAAASSSSTNPKTEHASQLQKLLPTTPYLWYYQMEQMYSTSIQNPQSDTDKLARRAWLAKLGLDIAPFNRVCVDPQQRDKVEVFWALKSAEVRRDIEQRAIQLKQPKHRMQTVPLRLAPLALRTPVPIKLIGLVPLTFNELEETYFNIPQGNKLAYYDLVPKRLAWLKQLGLEDPRYQPLTQTLPEVLALNKLYDEKPRVERRAIEAKAKYINAMLDPPNPSWETLEKAYEIYPVSAFTTHAAYCDKRREWLQQLGLDIAPFCYITLELAEGNMQGMEVAWSAMTAAERNKVLEAAKTIKENNDPVIDSWSEFEQVYGFIKEKDKEFKKDLTGYAKTRGDWIVAIGLDVGPYKNANSTPQSLQAAWSKKSIEERKVIIDKAKYEKERYVRDMARKKAAKASGNYKAPASEVKKTTKSSSGYRVSKSSSYRGSGYGGSSYSYRSSGYDFGYRRWGGYRRYY